MSKKYTLLIAEDEKNTRDGLLWGLERNNRHILTAGDGAEALEVLRQEEVDVLLTDLKMPEMDGMELMAQARKEVPGLEVIILTGHGTVENAVECIKKGAFDYILKPVNLEELNLLVDRVLTQKSLREENQAMREELEERHGFANMVGNSDAMRDVFERVKQVAPARAAVLITGESGTGKEMIASAIHYNSARRNGPFVKINCGAITPTLLESELFGHEAGAFTGAHKRKKGRFEVADGGTLFLDEITETSPEFQVKLLRVLQEQELERVGGTETIHVDVRLVTATNQNIEECVQSGDFREDLYYRLNVVKINVPPLRERQDDITLLAHAFLKEIGDQNGKTDLRIAPKAMEALRHYNWPGNVRQLRNVIEGLVVLSSGKEIQAKDLPPEIRGPATSGKAMQLQVGASIADMEREMIRATLKETNGNRAAAARILGLGRKTLYRKLEDYGLQDV